MRVTNRNLWRRNSVMKFFENTRKPQGFGGKIDDEDDEQRSRQIIAMGDSQISPRSLMLKFWTSAVAAEQILRSGLIDVEMAT